MDSPIRYLIATDEAGYGPNLGPLIVTATVWEVPPGVEHEELYELLQTVIVAERPAKSDKRIRVADSKALYKPRGGLSSIERGTLTALRCTGQHPIDRWRDVWQSLSPSSHEELGRLPWYAAYDESIPVSLPTESIYEDAANCLAGMAHAGVRLRAIESSVLFAGSFNKRLQELGNKSCVLSQVTVELVRRQIQSLAAGEASVLCDKHGGRNRYAAILQSCFDGFVRVRHESRASSRYCCDTGDRRVEFCFQAKADRILAAALASMVSKYLREMAMRAFNAFWQTQQRDLKPTAGYPSDARRFKSDIATCQRELGIGDAILWRER